MSSHDFLQETDFLTPYVEYILRSVLLLSNDCIQSVLKKE